MPINKKWNIKSVIDSCREYLKITGRRISFEYILINGVNNSPADARELARIIRGFAAHVNLIPVNEIENFSASTDEAKNLAFAEQLKTLGINATFRRKLGGDINAASGQLRGQSNAN